MISESYLTSRINKSASNDIPVWLVRDEYRYLGRDGLLAAMEPVMDEQKISRLIWKRPHRKGMRT